MLQKSFEKSCGRLPDSVTGEARSIFARYGPLHLDPSLHFLNNLTNDINNYYNLLKVELDKVTNPSITTTVEFHQISASINQFRNNMYNFDDNRGMCSDCKIKFIQKNSSYYCEKCGKIKERVFKFCVENTEEVRQNKTNIIKHYDETIIKIYGGKPSGAILPEEAIVAFRQELDRRNINILAATHYTSTLLNVIKQIGTLDVGGKIYRLRNYKENTNFILRQLYPDLVIPMLSLEEFGNLKHIFTNISAAHQELYPNNYANNYMYTIFKIIYMTLPYKRHAKNLLRFIYIQRPESFEEKDTKLAAVNAKTNIFSTFLYTDPHVYDNEEFYNPELY